MDTFVSIRYQLIKARSEKGEKIPNSLETILHSASLETSQMAILLEDQLRATLQNSQAKSDNLRSFYLQDVTKQVDALLSIYDVKHFPVKHARYGVWISVVTKL
jgi:hypothetical protein